MFKMFSKVSLLEKILNLFLGKISLAVYDKRNRHYFNLKLKYKVLCLSHNVAGFKNYNYNALNLLFKNVITAGRLKCCGMEDRTIVAHGYRKTKKIICGMEGENVVAYSPPLLPPVQCRVSVAEQPIISQQFWNLAQLREILSIQTWLLSMKYQSEFGNYVLLSLNM